MLVWHHKKGHNLKKKINQNIKFKTFKNSFLKGFNLQKLKIVILLEPKSTKNFKKFIHFFIINR